MTVKNVPPGGPVGPPSLDALDAPDALGALDGPDAPDALDALHAPDAPDAPHSLDAVTATPGLEQADPIADIARALSAHEIAPEHAVISLVEHSLDSPSVAALSAAERAGLRAELLALVADDPALAGMAARLGVSPGSATE